MHEKVSEFVTGRSAVIQNNQAAIFPWQNCNNPEKKGFFS
jgi:hypothetical protein